MFDVFAMGFDGFDADEKFFRDAEVVESAADGAEDLEFAVGVSTTINPGITKRRFFQI